MNEPRLLKARFSELSMPQRVALLTIYGCPLDGAVKDARGWTELDYWAAGQGHATYDDLGYLKSVKPFAYAPQEYREAWAVSGIRAGKTDCVAATVVAYEATCGGHEAFTRKGRPVICFQIAQDIRMAKYSLHSVKQTLESMPFLATASAKSWITNVTADRIELKNNVHIVTTPPTVKSIRGYDSPVSVLDEVAVWYQDADSANPDFEIYRQVSSRQAQFEFPKIIGISSPWNRAGLLHQRAEAGTQGRLLKCVDCRGRGVNAPASCDVCTALRRPHRHRVVIHGTTAAFNPIIPRAWLEAERDKDPRVFERECLASFQDSVSGFLSSVLIDKARDAGVTVRKPLRSNFYVAAMDPAFRRDAFGFTIVHADPQKGIVQDYVERWFDPSGLPLNPGEIMPAIASKLVEYGIRTVFSDQYTIETLQFIAQQHGFGIEEVTFSSGSKAEIYANLQQLLNQGRLSLLDDQETINELKIIEKKNTQGGQVRISAPEGKHDDMATVLAIAAHEAVWMLPKSAPPPPKKVSWIERDIERMSKKHRQIAAARDAASFDW